MLEGKEGVIRLFEGRRGVGVVEVFLVGKVWVGFKRWSRKLLVIV